jgi:hypothetical protein
VGDVGYVRRDDEGSTWRDVARRTRRGRDVGATWARRGRDGRGLGVARRGRDVGDVGDVRLDVGDVSTVPRVLPHLGLLPRTGQNA